MTKPPKDITDADGLEGGTMTVLEAPEPTALDVLEAAYETVRFEVERGDLHESAIPGRMDKELRKLSKSTDRGTPIRDTVAATLEHIRAREAGEVEAVPTPWEPLSYVLGKGFEPGIHVLTGGTGAGKSTFAVACAIHAAREGHPVAYVSLELDQVQLGARMLAELHNRTGEAPVYFSELYRGTTPPQVNLDKCAEELAALPIVIDAMDPFGWPASGLDAIAEKLGKAGAAKRPFIVLDYLQLVSDEADAGRPDARSRVGKAAAVAHGVARRTGAAVLILSSVARSYYPIVAGDSKKLLESGISFKAERPIRGETETAGEYEGFPLYGEDGLVGLGKESGEIEYTASSVIALVKSRATAEQWRGIAAAVAKNRFGRSAWIPLRFNGARFKVGNAADAEEIAASLEERRAATGGEKPAGKGDGAKTAATAGNGARELTAAEEELLG